MKTTIVTPLLAVLLIVLSACSSKPVSEETLQVKSDQAVRYQAPIKASAYSWKQLSGTKVKIVNPHSATLEFVAPKVEHEERLVFELYTDQIVSKQRLRLAVIVLPATNSEEGNTTTQQEDGGTTTNGEEQTSSGTQSDTNGTTGGSDTNSSTGEGTTDATLTLTSLRLESNTTTANKGEMVQLLLTGTYSDNSTKAVDANVSYTITPADSAEVNGSILTALKDGNVTVQATVGGVVSNSVKLHITWVVNGHVLPPEPDPTINNSTLLGIDSNNNGVRDDVERWIYEKYRDKHPIYIDIAMQAARGYRLVLEHPEKAKEIYPEVEKAIYCQMYYELDADELGDKILVKENILDEYFRSKIYYNTKIRMDAYDKYDTLLSGNSYTLLKPNEEKDACDFDVKKYKE